MSNIILKDILTWFTVFNLHHMLRPYLLASASQTNVPYRVQKKTKKKNKCCAISLQNIIIQVKYYVDTFADRTMTSRSEDTETCRIVGTELDSWRCLRARTLLSLLRILMLKPIHLEWKVHSKKLSKLKPLPVALFLSHPPTQKIIYIYITRKAHALRECSFHFKAMSEPNSLHVNLTRYPIHDCFSSINCCKFRLVPKNWYAAQHTSWVYSLPTSILDCIVCV